jgi:hypothetical protein
MVVGTLNMIEVVGGTCSMHGEQKNGYVSVGNSYVKISVEMPKYRQECNVNMDSRDAGFKLVKNGL